MVTTTFATKVTRIRNRRDKDYYIHRVNIPHSVVKELGIKDEDYLLMHAEKAEWYHLLDWSKMQGTWNKLPDDVKQKIEASKISVPTARSKSMPTFSASGSYDTAKGSVKHKFPLSLTNT